MIRALIVLALVAVAFAGSPSYVRVLHAFPGSSAPGPDVDVYLNGNVIKSSLAYKELFPAVEYAAISAGVNTFAVALAGTNTWIFDNVTQGLSDFTYYTVSAITDPNDASGNTPQASLSVDAIPAVVAHEAHVRAAHFFNGVGPVNVEAGGSAVFSDVSYGNVTAYSAGLRAPQDYVLDVVIASSGSTAGTFTASLIDGYVVTAYVIDDASAPTVAIDRQCFNGRIAHLAPAVTQDINMNTNTSLGTIVTALGQFELSQYVCMPADTVVELTVVDPAGPTNILTQVVRTGAAGERATIAIVDATAFIILSEPTPTPTDCDTAQIAFAHTAEVASAVPVDVRIVNGPTLFSNVAYGSRSAYAQVAAGTVNVEVTSAGTNTVVAGPLALTLEANKAYTAFATGPDLAGLTAVLGADGFDFWVADAACAPISPTLTLSPSPTIPPCEVTCECIKPSKVPPSDKPTKTFVPDPTKIPDQLYHYMEITFPTAGVSAMDCSILASVTGQTEWFFCGTNSEEKYAPETKGDKYTVQTFALAGPDAGELDETEAEAARDLVEASPECNDECKVSLKTNQKARCSAASIVASVTLLAAALALLL